MPKTTKTEHFEPVIIASAEGLRIATAELVRAKLKQARKQAEMEAECLKIQRKYADELAELDRTIATHEAGIQVYAEKHRTELLPADRKSLDLPFAVIGFRLNPPSVDKIKGKDTWGQIALRAQAYQETNPEGGVTFTGRNFVRVKDPELNKDALLSERATLPKAFLAAIGVAITQEETFYIEPKSEVVEGSTAQAA